MLILSSFNQILFIAITVITVLLTASWFIVRHKRKANSLKNVLYPADAQAAFGVFFGLFMCLFMMIMVHERADAAYAMIAGAVVCWMMIIPSFYCVLKFDDRGFEYRNYFGKTYKCRYAEIKGIRESNIYDRGGKKTGTVYKLFLYNGSLTLRIDKSDQMYFLDKIQRGYEEAVLRPLTISTSFGRKYDPMKGHTENPWGFIFGFLFCALLFSIFAVLIILEGFTFEWELKTASTEFNHWIYDDGSYILYSDEYDERFKIENYRSYDVITSNPDYFRNSGTYELVVDKEGKFLVVVSLTGENGKVYISPEQTMTANWNTEQVVTVVLAVLLFGAAYYFIMGIFVRRNPERYSKRVIKLYTLKERER